MVNIDKHNYIASYRCTLYIQQVGCFNRRVVTLVVVKLSGYHEWFILVLETS